MIIAVAHPKYSWFQRPCPSAAVTLGTAAVLFLWTYVLYRRRVGRLRAKFGAGQFTGSLRACAKISAYMDHHEEPGFAMLRLATKAIFFLGLLQWDFGRGFAAMLACLVVESSLDTLRVLLAYRNCRSLRSVQALADDEARDLLGEAARRLEPTNVYEDLTRPRSIAIMVFATQVLLIGLVVDDTGRTTTRTCFNGTDGCPMLTSLGSYLLYLVGGFMTIVFYVGPRNSYGKKEQNPTFWLKLFLLNKTELTFSWQDSAGGSARLLQLAPNDWRLWVRFAMSFLVNGIGFDVLLHILPVQVAGQSTIIGVVFRAVGMIYLVDLDDITGNVMTLVTATEEEQSAADSGASATTKGYGSNDKTGSGGAAAAKLSNAELEAEKQKIVQDAVREVEAKLQALARGERPAQQESRNRMSSITGALFLSTFKRNKQSDEETPLVK